MRRQDMPARPAMTTAQSMQMKNMRKEDLPEEMGMLKGMSLHSNGYKKSLGW